MKDQLLDAPRRSKKAFEKSGKSSVTWRTRRAESPRPSTRWFRVVGGDQEIRKKAEKLKLKQVKHGETIRMGGLNK